MAKLPPYATTGERVWKFTYLTICAAIFVFLITPILIIAPLSFNAEPYFSFTDGMLEFRGEAYSWRWYLDILTNGMADPDQPRNWSVFWDWLWKALSPFHTAPASFFTDAWENAQWIRAMRNSFFIGFFATLIAVTLGTLAAIGLSRSEMPARGAIMSILISPLIVPLVVTAAGMFYFYSQDMNPYNLFAATDENGETIQQTVELFGYTINLTSRWVMAQEYIGVILAHAALGTPFVIITVTATLVGFDKSLVRAGASMGAGPAKTFWKIQMPLILPGVVSGGLFAFITSFDEVVAALFLAGPEQKTIPRQMYSGIREQISPTILAVATILVILSVLMLATLELLRRRSERLRGMTPA